MANIRLGQLLVDARMLSQQALDDVLELQKIDGRRLGTLLVERGLVNETQLTQILSHQLSVPWVALLHIEFSRQLLNLVPYEVAEKFCLVPIYVRHVRGQGDTLYVAMDDPTNEEPLRECMTYSGLPVRAMIAPPSDIREAIRVCYGIEIDPPHSKAALAKASTVKAPPPPPSSSSSSLLRGERTQESPRSTPPPLPRTPPPVPPPSSRPRSDVVDEPTMITAELPVEAPALTQVPKTPRVTIAEAPPLPAPASAGAFEVPPSTAKTPLPPPSSRRAALPPGVDAPDVEAHEIEIPRSRRRLPDLFPSEGDAGPSSEGPSTRRGGRARLVSLTLLDGTTLTLPGRSSKPSSSSEPEAPEEATEQAPPSVTTRDVIEALKAACNGGDAGELLGTNARWEAMFAALLSLLLRKGLITNLELMEELKKL